MLRIATATALLLFGLSANLSAETINTTTETKAYSVELPVRGMSMDRVQTRFGKPLEKTAAVGTPPISKWRYKIFTVYFESQFVIHAVANN